MTKKIVIQLAATALLIALNHMAVAQPAVTPLPQATQPQISDQTKALFRQRWADGAAAATTAANNPAMSTVQTAAQVVPATATANPSAANPPPENRANQQAYLDKINQAMKGH